MACCSQQTYGYEDSRFQHPVSESFHCPICFNVLKQPKMCVNNQHVFCQDCIMTHLQNDLTCPECREELTEGTLKPVHRVLMNGLSELLIKCDYYERGCHGYVEVGNLDNHVMKCGFAPTQCSNDGCRAVVNKRDILHHEKEICQFRRVKCHECGELRNEIVQLRKSFHEKHSELRNGIGEVRQQVMANLQGMNNDFKQQMSNIEGMLGQMFEKIKVDNVKVNLEMKKSQEVIQEQLGQLTTKLNIVQHTTSSLYEEQILTKKDIIIAGGWTEGSWDRYVEMYSWDKGSWAQLPKMKTTLIAASCCVYQSQVFVVGARGGYNRQTDIEVMNIEQEPLQWQTFTCNLPIRLRHHKTVVYDNKLIVIGGQSEEGISKNIYEILLTPPYSSKLLSNMTIPRVSHGVELVNNKVFILGGEKSFSNNDLVDNVCEYDVVKKEFREMSPLPYAVSKMSTVALRNKIIVIGGWDRNREVLNKVVMYDVETGESETLPYMKYKRLGCAAVATGDGMVVMGGCDEKYEKLKSVEYFNMSSRSWQELPSMIKARLDGSAVVKP